LYIIIEDDLGDIVLMLRIIRSTLVPTRAAALCRRNYINSSTFLTGEITATDLPRFSLPPIAHLADGSAVCVGGNTAVFAVISSKRNYDVTDSFLPLTVDYRSRQYAYGSIPSNSQKRERHGTDEEILVGRVIDRAIRPLFPKGYVNEVQVTVTPQGIDKTVDPIVLAVNATSCALLNSNQPWNGPIGCVRVGLVDGEFVENPTVQEMAKSTLDLLYAGTTVRSLM
jgi:polyribonucleotide nucleotidyltransferase